MITMADTEMKFISFERVFQFSQIPKEQGYAKDIVETQLAKKKVAVVLADIIKNVK